MKKSLMTLSLIMMASLAQAATVAVLNGDKVDSSEVESYEKLLKQAPELAKATAEEINQMAFVKLVEDKVLTAEAKKRGLDKAKEYTDFLAQMEAELKKQGADKEPLYKERWELTKKEVLKRSLADDVFNKQKPDDALARQIMDSFNKTYAGSKFYQFERIGVQSSDDAKKVYAELKKKTEFKDVKKKFDKTGDKEDQVFTLNSKDLEHDDPKLAKAISIIKPGTYNQEAIEVQNFKFVFKMDKVEDFKPAKFEQDKESFREQSRMFNTELYLGNLLRDAKFEAKDDKYKFYGEMLEQAKKQPPIKVGK